MADLEDKNTKLRKEFQQALKRIEELLVDNNLSRSDLDKLKK